MTAAPIGDAENTLILVLAYGTVAIDLAPEIAPQTVAQIKTLAREGEYDNVAWHRVYPGFMAQTGDVEFGDLSDGFDSGLVGRGGSDLPDLPLEPSDTPFLRGVVGMARALDPNSGNSQFFIVTKDSTFLNGNYTAFGEVLDGMGAVDLLKQGLPANNGVVTGTPDRILRAFVAEDLAPGATSVGTVGRDRVEGSAAAEAFLTFSGNDVVRAAGGADTLVGGDGNDRLYGAAGNDLVTAGTGDDIANGGAGKDTLGGSAGDDVLSGGAGRDRLSGDSGDDTLNGGAGGDTFVFAAPGFGQDRIAGGFVVGEDRIDLRGSGYALEDATLRETRAGTVISFDDGADRILIAGATDILGNEDAVFLF
jgi:cyclophilin family peptidyl-prolyl cis-trans isomerase